MALEKKKSLMPFYIIHRRHLIQVGRGPFERMLRCRVRYFTAGASASSAAGMFWSLRDMQRP
jgi:hypothetical protein